jgi:Transposase DDE domain
MRGRVSDPFQPLRAAQITNAPGFAGGWLPACLRRPRLPRVQRHHRGRAPQARDFTNRRVRQPCGEDETERRRNRNKSRTRAPVEHAFHVLKQLWGFAKLRYRGLANIANRAFTALALVNLYMAARRLPALVRP